MFRATSGAGMRAWLAPALVVLLLLAGCSSKGTPNPSDSVADAAQKVDVKATSNTGVIRGVVVDAAVHPVAGASVSVVVGGKATRTNTSADGAFGFQGLQPATYIVQAKKVGFISAQTSVDVQAGVDNPKSIKIQLTPDPATSPYYTQYKLDGYIECSFSLVAVGYALCSQAGGSDVFAAEYTLDREPTWTQSEMVWDSTQAVSNELDMVYSYDDGQSALLNNYVDAHGPSPVIGHANQTVAHRVGLGTNTTLLIRVFNQPVNGTRPSDPVGGDNCVDRPALGGCVTGAGMTVEQPFTVYTTVFYGYTPPVGWTFLRDGVVPPPT